MLKKIGGNKGFSLVEVVIGLVILLIMEIVFYSGYEVLQKKTKH